MEELQEVDDYRGRRTYFFLEVLPPVDCPCSSKWSYTKMHVAGITCSRIHKGLFEGEDGIWKDFGGSTND